MKVPGAPPGTFISGSAVVSDPDSCVLPHVVNGRCIDLHGAGLRAVRSLDYLTGVDQAGRRPVLLSDLGAGQQREPVIRPWVNEGTSWRARREDRELGSDPDRREGRTWVGEPRREELARGVVPGRVVDEAVAVVAENRQRDVVA